LECFKSLMEILLLLTEFWSVRPRLAEYLLT
jgi:hypothetical protein